MTSSTRRGTGSACSKRCVDTTTDEPAVVTVRTGLPTRPRLVFLPLYDALLGPGYVKIAYTRSLVRKAPSIGTDDILPAEHPTRERVRDSEGGQGARRTASHGPATAALDPPAAALEGAHPAVSSPVSCSAYSR